MTNETSTARLEGALPPTRYPVARPRRGDQYSAAHTARDGVALPLAHPFAPVGDGGPLAQLVGDRSCPARRDGPSCGASCGRERALIFLCPPRVWSSRPLWTAL